LSRRQFAGNRIMLKEDRLYVPLPQMVAAE
jgi:hypothetical protein